MTEEDIDFNERTQMIIKDPAMKKNGLNAQWRSGHKLMVYASANQHPNQKTTDHPVLLHEVEWNNDVKTQTGRKLVNESSLVFKNVQQLYNGIDVTSKSQLLEFSRNYRSILQSCTMQLEQKYKASEQDEKTEKEMQLYSMMELIWSLCEILFIEVLPDGIILLQLIDWCKWHFPYADELVQRCTCSEDEMPPMQHPSYWNAIFSLVLLGRTSEARDMLKLHPSYQTQVYDAFSSIDELLRKMPIFSNQQGQSTNEFEMKWRHWHDECVKRLRDGDFDTNPQLKVIAKILCGDQDIFKELMDLSGSWFQTLASYLLYKNPLINVYDLHYHSKFCIDMFGGESQLGPLDNILLAAFKFDVPQVIKESCSHFSSWWLPAHLTDILHYCGLIPSNTTENGSDLRGHLLVQYASSLANLDSLWNIVIDYLSYCGSQSQHFLQLFIQRVPLTSERKATKLLRQCMKYGFVNECRSICRQMGVHALQYNRHGTALSWGIRGNDVLFQGFIANKMLTKYSRTGVFMNIDLVDHLEPSVIMSERLTLLAKYRDFHKLYANEKFHDAGQLLLKLLVSNIAPLDFWSSLLMDCLPLLEKDEIIYGIEETTNLLSCLNKLAQKEEIWQQLTTTEQQNQHKKMQQLRLALTNNLAKAIVNRT